MTAHEIGFLQQNTHFLREHRRREEEKENDRYNCFRRTIADIKALSSNSFTWRYLFQVMTEPAVTIPSVLALHVWPGKWGLPSFDPTCLATILYFQLVLPGAFSILECNNPDISPSGRWVLVCL